MYYLLCGVLPFQGKNQSQMIEAIISAKVTFPKKPEISEEGKLLIKRMLEANPKKRIKMGEIVNDDWIVGDFFRT